MEASDWIAVGAALISVAALAIGIVHRRNDIAREDAFFVKARVSETLSNEPGMRTVDALDEDDGQSRHRVKLLERTANQLDVAGAPDLATLLRDTLSQPWGKEATVASTAAREAFQAAVRDFMSPGRPPHA